MNLDRLYSPRLSIEVLRDLISHNPETGELFWKTRPAKYFAQQSTLNICDSWNKRYAGKPALNTVVDGYGRGEIFGIGYSSHRVMWALHYGEWPDKIDHINGDPTDNRIVNLRSVTHSENMRNCKGRKDRPLPSGVYWVKSKRRWAAAITYNRRCIHLGMFGCVNDALLARKAAERKYGFHPNHGRKHNA